jgi:hypothetical protein
MALRACPEKSAPRMTAKEARCLTRRPVGRPKQEMKDSGAGDNVRFGRITSSVELWDRYKIKIASTEVVVTHFPAATEAT